MRVDIKVLRHALIDAPVCEVGLARELLVEALGAFVRAAVEGHAHHVPVLDAPSHVVVGQVSSAAVTL